MTNRFDALSRKGSEHAKETVERNKAKKAKNDQPNRRKYHKEAYNWLGSDSQEDSIDSASSYDFDEEMHLPWYDRVKQAKILLRRRPKKDEPRYTEEKAESSLKDALLDMEDYDFLVRVEAPEYFKDRNEFTGKPKHFRRVVYLKFECKACNKKFTSICGTLEATFLMRPLRIRQWMQHLDQMKRKGELKSSEYMRYEEIKYPLMARFTTKIYRMKCQQCFTYCEGKIYDSHLMGLEIQFAHIMSEIAKNVPAPDPFPHQIPDIHYHKRQWCQACSLNRCAAQNIPKDWTRSTNRINGKIQANLRMHMFEEEDD